MNKDYKKYVEQVNQLNIFFAEEVQKRTDEANHYLVNWEHAETFKEEIKKELFADLGKTSEGLSKLFKKVVKHFCADFQIVLPDDEKDHTKDIENGLRIIDMLGFGLDAKNLENIMRPLRQSYKSMKMIVDVIEAKNNIAVEVGVGYSKDLLSKMYECMGIDTNVNEYLHLFSKIEEIQTGNDKYGFQCSDYRDSVAFNVVDRIPYAFLCCPEWMTKAGEMYSDLENEFAMLFKNHIPNDKEVIEGILRNQ